MKKNSVVRASLAVAGILLCLWLALTFLAQMETVDTLNFLIDQLGLIGWAVLILVCALSFGCGVLKWTRLRPAGSGARALFGVGLGLGAISILMLGLGAVGFIGRIQLVILLMALLFLGMGEMGPLLRDAGATLKRMRGASAFRLALWGVLAFFLLLNITRAFEPPWEYDTLEYHLASAAAYDKAGHVFFIRDNAYANFPQNVEMLHLLCMRLTGSPDRGALAGQLLVVGIGFLAALALREMLAHLAGREVADAGAAIFYAWPGTTLYAGGHAYVEFPLMFYGVLALWGLLWSWRRKLSRPGPRGWIVLAGIAAGLACGVKYTAVLLICAPIALWIIVLGLCARLRWKETAWRFAAFGLLAVLVFSPWLARNYANTRNPVYPLLYKVFGSTNWDAQKDARWNAAHSPKDLSAGNFVDQTKDAVFFDEHKASMLMFVFIPLALLAGRRTRGVALLLSAHALVILLLWFAFTQQIVRFVEMAFPVAAGLSALGLGAALRSRYSRGLRPLVVALLVLGPWCWLSYLCVTWSLGCAVGGVSTQEYFKGSTPIDFKPGYAAMQFMNDDKNVPAQAQVLFLGEARTFYCRRDYRASTVFDTNLLEETVRDARTPGEIYTALIGKGITHVYIDAGELLRLQTSYRYPWRGQERLGMLDGFNWSLFAEFAQAHLKPLYVFPSNFPQPFPWQRWPEVLEMPSRQRPAFLALYEIR